MNRSTTEFYETFADGLKYAEARYLDPKNEEKGDILDERPTKLLIDLFEETNESAGAYVNNESPERQLEELGDVILVALARIKQIEVANGL